MATQDQSSAIHSALAQIHNALTALDDLIASASTEQAKSLKPVYDQLVNLSTSLAKSQTVADDAVFKTVTADLKSQAAQLQKEDAAMQKVLGEVDKAGKVVVYIGQGLALIAKL